MQLQEKCEYPLDGKERTETIVYKYLAPAYEYLNKVSLGTADGDFKQRFYNHIM